MRLLSLRIGPSLSSSRTCPTRFGELGHFSRGAGANGRVGCSTPMNGIIGMTDLTLDTELTRTQKENLLLVHQLAKSLLLIIDDILDISKSELAQVFGESRH